jgi:hypothetical protein
MRLIIILLLINYSNTFNINMNMNNMRLLNKYINKQPLWQCMGFENNTIINNSYIYLYQNKYWQKEEKENLYEIPYKIPYEIFYKNNKYKKIYYEININTNNYNFLYNFLNNINFSYKNIKFYNKSFSIESNNLFYYFIDSNNYWIKIHKQLPLYIIVNSLSLDNKTKLFITFKYNENIQQYFRSSIFYILILNFLKLKV